MFYIYSQEFIDWVNSQPIEIQETILCRTIIGPMMIVGLIFMVGICQLRFGRKSIIQMIK